MKTLLHKINSVRFLVSLFLSLMVSQSIVLPLLADEFKNISDIKGCRAIKGEAERLACYDTVSGGGVFNEQKLEQVRVEEFGSDSMKRTPKPEPEPAPAAAAAAVSGAGAARETVTAPATGKGFSVDEINVTIVRRKKDGNGFHYFQTSGGQVWKQINAGAWGLAAPFDAKIEAGVLGSFFLVSEGGMSTRVKRVK